MEDHAAPCNHVDGVVIEQFELRRELGDIVARARAGCQQLETAAAEAGKRGFCANAVRVRDFVAFIKDQLHFLIVAAHPALDLPFELPHLIERYNDEIAAFDLLEISEASHEHVRQRVILQHDVPVVPYGDRRRNHPSRVHVLIEHPIGADRDGRERFPAALFPLEHSVPLLQHQIDVVTLEIVEVNVLLVLRVPKREPVEPEGERVVLIHLRKRTVLVFILPLLSAKKALKTGIVLRRVVQHGCVDRRRRAHIRCDQRAHPMAVRLVDETVILLDERNFVALRFPILPAQCFLEIRHHFLLRQFDTIPFLFVHFGRLFLRVELMQVLAATGVAILCRGMHLDLIQELLRLIRKPLRGRAGARKLQEHIGLVLLQICFRQHQHLFVEYPRLLLDFIIVGKRVQDTGCVLSRRPAGSIGFLLPELELRLELLNTERCEHIVGQLDLPQKAELGLHCPYHTLIREVVRQEGLRDDKCKNTQRLHQLRRFQAVVQL